MRRLAMFALVGLVSVFGSALPAHADTGTVSVSYATLTGAAEVPGPGDPDGSGWAEVVTVPDLGLVCYVIVVSGIETATAAHIHVGGPTVAGPVVVHLKAPNRAGVSAGCVRDVDPELAANIAHNPGAYYVNVHNTPFPGGAVRGQLA